VPPFDSLVKQLKITSKKLSDIERANINRIEICRHLFTRDIPGAA